MVILLNIMIAFISLLGLLWAISEYKALKQ